MNAVDLWVTGIYAEKAIAASANVKDIKLVLKINDQTLWLACHPGLADTTIKALSDALAAMKKDGAYDKIFASYDKRFAP